MWSTTPAPASSDGDPPAGDGGPALPERQQRTNLFLAARLSLSGEPPRDVRVRNLSASGARIDLSRPPPTGTTLLLCRGAAEVAGEVIWSSEASCGLRFSQEIDVARWMSDRPQAAAASLREPTLAEDLALARQLVGRVEDAVSAQPAVVALLGTELQALDLLAQLLASSEKRAAGSTVPTFRRLQQAAATFLRQPPLSGG
ncbi:hypothetical protein GGQ97_001005 [Sphingomonas kaistensis]|uniref:PilZ domain-containing protein n=1 Tax=Sphingomonas kaistensis TaxID=298708 RepID=A0A7X6BGM6_9SPHN|nr:PilZ domain-containing protein [Sphingomonas kaistensis]NJC05212.1 hypothetical protein [Sphingomonas kaistensis]